MSKWIKEDKFKDFVNKKANEAPNESSGAGDFFDKWKNPTMGTVDKAKEYRIRLLPDPESNFYTKYMFHYFVIDEKHYFIHCPKSDGMDNYCPWCAVNQMLFKGNKEDKKLAYNYRRNEKFVTNIFVVDDPRDEDKDDEYKSSGKVKLYEFPSTIESKIKNEITDKAEGYGMAVYDPENGYDMIIKIKAKKPDKNGKVWPDYSDTIFSRKSSAIADTEKGIEDLMEKTTKIDDYLDSKKLSWDEHKKLLQVEGFWEDIEEEFERRTGTGDGSEKQPEKQPEKHTSDSPDPSIDDQSDEDLLNELKNM